MSDWTAVWCSIQERFPDRRHQFSSGFRQCFGKEFGAQLINSRNAVLKLALLAQRIADTELLALGMGPGQPGPSRGLKQRIAEAGLLALGTDPGQPGPDPWLPKLIADAELLVPRTGPDQDGPDPGLALRTSWQKRIERVSKAAFAQGVQAGIEYDKVHAAIGNVAAACLHLIAYGMRIRKPEEDWEPADKGFYKPPFERLYLICGEARRLLQEVRLATNELLVLNEAIIAKSVGRNDDDGFITAKQARLAIRDGEVYVDGKHVPIVRLTTGKKIEAIMYLACLTVNDWKSDTDIYKECPALDGTRLDKIRRKFPDEIKRVYETNRRKGTRLLPIKESP